MMTNPTPSSSDLLLGRLAKADNHHEMMIEVSDNFQRQQPVWNWAAIRDEVW